MLEKRILTRLAPRVLSYYLAITTLWYNKLFCMRIVKEQLWPGHLCLSLINIRVNAPKSTSFCLTKPDLDGE